MTDALTESAAGGWFPTGTGDTPGWRLDIVSLLAVIGESSMAEHSQAMTASWLGCLPRIIPAPQVLLKATRPTRMPSVNAAVVGVQNGILIQSLNFFPNILHPIEDLNRFAFRYYIIEHAPKPSVSSSVVDPDYETKSRPCRYPSCTLPAPVTAEVGTAGKSSSIILDTSSAQLRGPVHAESLVANMRRQVTHSERNKLPPHIPTRFESPLNLLSILSCLLTVGLFILAALDHDGVACLALFTISSASAVVGFASLWSPKLMKRTSAANVPQGDVVVRTREGAFILVKADENVARELYSGTEECDYHVKNVKAYRVLVGIGTFLLMISVVLLGNCNFNQQAAIGGSYIVLNGLYWGAALFSKRTSWDLSMYRVTEVTEEALGGKYAEDGDPNDPDVENRPSFTRTMWYAIRETKDVGWVRKSGAAPETPEWDEWLKRASLEAGRNNRSWKAVAAKDEIVGQTDQNQGSPVASSYVNNILVLGGQQAPAISVPPETRK